MWLRTILDEKQHNTLVNLHRYVKKSVSSGLKKELSYYTLHDEPHWIEIENIMGLILEAYKENKTMCQPEDIFLLLCSIPLHDSSLYISLTESQLSKYLDDFKVLRNPIEIGELQRKMHNELVDEYVDIHAEGLMAIGLEQTELAIIKEVCRLHRGNNLKKCTNKLIKKLAVILRIADELDIGASRAPKEFFRSNHSSMNEVSKRHWTKHIVTANWRKNFDVNYCLDGHSIIFQPHCFPPELDTRSFLMDQIMKPLNRELSACEEILISDWFIEIKIDPNNDLTKKGSWGQDEEILKSIIRDWKAEEYATTGDKATEKYEKTPAPQQLPYGRATDNSISDYRVADNPNLIGTHLTELYKTEFDSVVASKKNEEKLKKIWSPPVFYDNEINEKQKSDITPLSCTPLINLNEGENSIDALEKLACEFISLAKGTAVNNEHMIIFGERGSGKTTTLNAAFITQRKLFRENMVFWLRLSLMHDVDITASDWKDEKIFFSVIDKFSRILFDPENGYFEELCPKNLLTNDIFNAITKVSPDNTKEFWNELISYSQSHAKEFFDYMTRVMFKAGYRFIFIVDNLDHIEDKAKEEKPHDHKIARWVEERVNGVLCVAFMNKYIKIRSFNIIVARGNSVNKYLPHMLDARILHEHNLRTIGLVNKDDVMKRRLDYINEKYSSHQLKLFIKGKEVTFNSVDGLIKVFNNYLLEKINMLDSNYIITALSGDSVVDLFKMAQCILKTHIIDFSHVISGYWEPELSELKKHHLLWALMLPDKRKYYSKDNTWIFNIYHNYNDTEEYVNNCEKGSSLLLKRLVLESFRNDQDMIMKNVMEIYHNFVQELGFDKLDVKMSLEDLSGSGLLYKSKNNARLDLYGITRKGKFIRDYVQNQYIYHELVIEDTPVPLDLKKCFKLFEYDPIKDNKKYFLKKAPLVRKFICFLEDSEKEHLKRIGRTAWFNDKFIIFPKLKEVLKEQEKSIASALGIRDVNVLEGSWGG